MPHDSIHFVCDGTLSARFGSSIADWFLWSGLLLLALAVILGRMLTGMGSLVYDSRSVDKETGKPIRGGAAIQQLQPVGLIRFSLLEPQQFSRQIGRLGAGSVNLISRWLRFDYGFMRLAYPAMILLGLYLVEHPDVCTLFSCQPCWRWVVIVLPLLAWIADFLENQASSRAIRHTSASLVATDPPLRAAAEDRSERWIRYMRIASILKWIFVTAAIALVAGLAIIALIRYPA